MTTLNYSESFVEDVSQIYSLNIINRIEDAMSSIEAFPHLGSANIATSIRAKYGDSVRKLVVAPYDIIYEYNEMDDVVEVLGLVHFRQAY